jgi:catechol 2,3-dioxygenase-like lactoylglutathione lyase family enzyme
MSLRATIEVADLDRSIEFYDGVLAPLGWRRGGTGQKMGWGLAKPEFFVVPNNGAKAGTSRICFAARSVPAVKDCWEAALRLGGEDEGRPGQRPEFGPAYYCAFARDPDGHRLEFAVLPD